MAKENKSLEERDADRIKLLREYDDGTGIGIVPNIKNVNVSIWKDFKMIARLHGNSEGAALTSCVQAWMSNPANAIKIVEMKERLSKKEGESK